MKTNNILNYFKILIFTIIIVILLMSLVALIPRENIKNNIIKSAYQINALGEKQILNLRI